MTRIRETGTPIDKVTVGASIHQNNSEDLLTLDSLSGTNRLYWDSQYMWRGILFTTGTNKCLIKYNESGIEVASVTVADLSMSTSGGFSVYNGEVAVIARDASSVEHIIILDYDDLSILATSELPTNIPINDVAYANNLAFVGDASQDRINVYLTTTNPATFIQSFNLATSSSYLEDRIDLVGTGTPTLIVSRYSTTLSNNGVWAITLGMTPTVTEIVSDLRQYTNITYDGYITLTRSGRAGFYPNAVKYDLDGNIEGYGFGLFNSFSEVGDSARGHFSANNRYGALITEGSDRCYIYSVFINTPATLKAVGYDLGFSIASADDAQCSRDYFWFVSNSDTLYRVPLRVSQSTFLSQEVYDFSPELGLSHTHCSLAVGNYFCYTDAETFVSDETFDIYILDTTDNSMTVTTLPRLEDSQSITTDGTYIYAKGTQSSTTYIYRIDPTDGSYTTLGSFGTDTSGQAIVYGGGFLWTVYGTNIFKINPSSWSVTTLATLPFTATLTDTTAVYCGGYIVFANTLGMCKIDPSTNTVTDLSSLTADPSTVSTYNDLLYVCDAISGTPSLHQVDLSTDTILYTFEFPGLLSNPSGAIIGELDGDLVCHWGVHLVFLNESDMTTSSKNCQLDTNLGSYTTARGVFINDHLYIGLKDHIYKFIGIGI